jgi:DNA-binding SARP family transcriptional activator
MLLSKRNLTLTLLILFLASGLQAQNAGPESDYGLSFSSHEVTKDQRTSLALTPQVPFRFTGDFEVKFDLSFKRLTDAYGYVLRIIANDTLNIDLVSSPEHEEFHDLNLIINNRQTGIHFNHQDLGLQPMTWTSVVIQFEKKKNIISVSWGGQRKEQTLHISGLSTFRFYFGANDFGKFNTSDVPPMIIRDIGISATGGRQIKWDLQKHGINEVYDNTHTFAASVKNATWLIDKHIRWAHVKELTVGRYPSAAFNSASGELYVTDKNNLYMLSANGMTRQKKIQHGNPVYTDANQTLYIAETNTLVNYDLHAGKLSRFDFEQNRWENTDTTYNLPNYWHNNKFYNPVNKSVYTFGGYGHFSYKNKFMRYDTAAQQWTEVQTTGSIPPRYLGASGLTSTRDKALIFGGYGSESGKQELFPQSFYDLYTFDLRTHEVKKIWQFKSAHSDEDIVFSNSLVINEEDTCFYVLSFPKNRHDSFITLRKYSLTNPAWQILADTIPFQFHDEHSFCDLFLSQATKQLIAVTSHKEKDHYKINVYSINYPPLIQKEVFQHVRKTSNASLYTVLGLTLMLGGAIAAFVYARKRRKQPEITPKKTQGSHPVNGTEIVKALPETKASPAIHLFGGFQALDRNGNDITGKFSMTLKELFVLILLHSAKSEHGISTATLQEHLWPDKDDMSARNNRNVNLKKLRGLLEEIGGITIENNNAYLQLAIGDNIVCDYYLVSRILAHDHAIDAATIEVLLKYVKRGNLLPDIQTTWLDNFKSDISNRIIDMLLEYSQKLDVTKDDRVLLEIADTIFNYDSINQEALVIKCSVLNKKGKYSLAKTWYDHFAKEYKTLYAESYPKTFDEVIS